MKDVNCPETSGRGPENVHEQRGDALWTVERTPNGSCMDSGGTPTEVQSDRNPVYYINLSKANDDGCAC
jgi:hypothetical protein